MSETPRKKRYIELPNVSAFLASIDEAIVDEYREIVFRLEVTGRLSMPFGEKISGENLFAMRVIRTGNVRVFYVYGNGDIVYGISGYVKKTQAIPRRELRQARAIARELKQRGLI